MSKALSNKKKLNDIVDVVADYGADPTGVADSTTAIANAISALPANGTLYFPAGIYLGYILLRKSSVSIVGAGSGATTIKLPNSCPSITVPWSGGGTVTGLPNVIEIGECALGNSANTYSKVVVKGLTIDGNYSNNTAPTSDLFGHGLIATKTSNLFIDDVVAKDCYLTGIDCVIDSNYAIIKATTSNCGNALVSATHYPNFDVNSSKYGNFNVISYGGYYGARMLDNCYGNELTCSIYSPSFTGFVYNNQTANNSYGNILNITVIDGCASGQGMSVGSNCYNSIINATIRNVTGNALVVQGSSATYAPRGNTFNINSYNCGGRSVYDAGISNQYFINSRFDGRTGAVGSSFAVDINGSYSQYAISVEDSTVAQVRGVVIRAGAVDNRIIDYVCNTTVQDFLNQDTSNTNTWNYKGGAVVRNALRLIPLTVATLPSASTTGAGAKAFVSDANATMTAGIGAVVAGGGANNVPVYSDGTNWRIG